jgi:hypothetical protein
MTLILIIALVSLTTSKIGSSRKRKYELFKDIGEETDPGTRSVKKTRLSDAFALDKKLLFLFDYGDEWEFIVECAGKEEPLPARKYPFLINKTGVSPEQYPASEETV